MWCTRLNFSQIVRRFSEQDIPIQFSIFSINLNFSKHYILLANINFVVICLFIFILNEILSKRSMFENQICNRNFMPCGLNLNCILLYMLYIRPMQSTSENGASDLVLWISFTQIAFKARKNINGLNFKIRFG